MNIKSSLLINLKTFFNRERIKRCLRDLKKKKKGMLWRKIVRKIDIKHFSQKKLDGGFSVSTEIAVFNFEDEGEKKVSSKLSEKKQERWGALD